MSEERAIQQTDLIQDAGKLYETAVLDQKELATSEQQQIEYKRQQEEEHALKIQKEQQDYWNKVQNTVNEGKLSNVQIPEADKDNFYNYMAIAKDQYGRSQAMIDAENSSIEDTLMLEYLRFKGFNLNSLITAASQNKRAQALKLRIKKSADTNTGNNQPLHIQQVDSSGEGVTLENIIPRQ